MKTWIPVAAAIGFVGGILLANIATSTYGMVPVGFGLVATAGTCFAGLTFILRDLVHDYWGRRATVVLIATGLRYRYAAAIGCDSADGTTLAKFPKTITDVLSWVTGHQSQPSLIGGTA